MAVGPQSYGLVPIGKQASPVDYRVSFKFIRKKVVHCDHRTYTSTFYPRSPKAIIISGYEITKLFSVKIFAACKVFKSD